MSEWAEWLMWQSDGRPVSHPTFALALESYMRRSSLQKQGHVAVSLDEVDPNLTVTEFEALLSSDEGQESLLRHLQSFAGNVRGTSQYWASQKHRFKAKLVLQVFHDGSRILILPHRLHSRVP